MELREAVGRGRETAPLHKRTMVEGVIGRTLSALTVALWFLCLDVLTGQPFRTPALLGATVFDGLRDPGALHITPRLVLAYTVLHWLAFITFGLVLAGLLAAADQDPGLLFVVCMLLCRFEVFALGLISILAEWLFEVLTWWSLILGNLHPSWAAYGGNHGAGWSSAPTAGTTASGGCSCAGSASRPTTSRCSSSPVDSSHINRLMGFRTCSKRRAATDIVAA
jgi:hypothetical protein